MTFENKQNKISGIESLNNTEVVIGDKKYNLNIEKSNFSYPENIQKETGIIGYERQSIDFKNLQQLIQDSFNGKNNLVIGHDYTSNQKIVNLEFYEKNKKSLSTPTIIESYTDIEHLFPPISQSVRGFLKDKTKNMTEEESSRFTTEYLNNLEFSNEIIESIVISLCESLSQKEFPDQTYNHVVGAMGRGFITEEQKQKLFSDRVFLQKISPGKSGDSSYKLFSNETGEEILEEEDKNNLDNELTKINFQGLSVQDFGLWGGPHNLFRAPTFGFSPNDSLFSEYLQKTKKLFESSGDIQKNKKKYATKDLYNNESHREIKKSIDYILEHPKATKEERKNRLSISNTGDMDDHPWVPIVMNNPSISELRWGFCKYAIIPTEKGLNFIKMIHNTESK
ncbi:MAG: hypothetical protein WCT42_02760 [Candidatus Paceibacterota bacterium]